MRFLVSIISIFCVSLVAPAEGVPTLDELREYVDRQAELVEKGKELGFSYVAYRHWKSYVPFEALPDKITLFETKMDSRHEIFMRAGDKRALATRTRMKRGFENGYLDSFVMVWDGNVYQDYQPVMQMATIRAAKKTDEFLDDEFPRMRDPFSMALLPMGVKLSGTCLSGRCTYPESLTELLRRDDVLVLDEIEEFNGSLCVVVADDSGPILWLDKDRGYAVRKFIEPVTQFEGVEYLLHFIEEVEQAAPGLWVPTRAYIQFRGPGIAYKHVTVQDILCQISFSYEAVEFNTPIDEKAFDIALPPGTSFRDEREEVKEWRKRNGGASVVRFISAEEE